MKNQTIPPTDNSPQNRPGRFDVRFATPQSGSCFPSIFARVSSNSLKNYSPYGFLEISCFGIFRSLFTTPNGRGPYRLGEKFRTRRPTKMDLSWIEQFRVGNSEYHKNSWIQNSFIIFFVLRCKLSLSRIFLLENCVYTKISIAFHHRESNSVFCQFDKRALSTVSKLLF